MQLEKSTLGASKEVVMFYFSAVHKVHRMYMSYSSYLTIYIITTLLCMIN